MALHCKFNWSNSIGIPACNWGAHPSRHGMHFSCVFGVLLHHKAWDSQRFDPSRVGWCPQLLSPISYYLSHHWHSSCPIFPPPPTLSCSLSPPHQDVWHTQWPLFVDHWIKTHQGCEGTLAMIKLLWGPWPDVSDESAAWYISCQLCSFYNSRYAQWHLSFSSTW